MLFCCFLVVDFFDNPFLNFAFNHFIRGFFANIFSSGFASLNVECAGLEVIGYGTDLRQKLFGSIDKALNCLDSP